MGIHNLQAQRRVLSLAQLEGQDWGPPTFDSHLVRTCHQLSTKPIGEFTAGDLRIMIGQQIGLIFLVPLALEKLSVEPLLEANFYPGDLLCNVLRLPKEFWTKHWNLRQQLEIILQQLPQDSREDFQDVAEAIQDYRALMA